MTDRRSLALFSGALSAALLAASLGAATITVNTTSSAAADDGLCTFNEALHAANNNVKSGNTAGECVAGSPGLDTITFQIPGSGVHTITPLPDTVPATIRITEPIFIDGFSQPGSLANSNPGGQGLNATLLIELDLSSSGPLDVNLGASNSTIRGLVLNRSSQAAIVFEDGTNHVEGCYIGTNPSGTAAGPGNLIGIVIGSSGNTIGGSNPPLRNLISGNSNTGIQTSALPTGNDNVVQGNLIGTNAAGTAAVANGSGVAIADSRHSNNLIGGTNAAARNVISGNTVIGVALNGTTGTSRTPGTFVQGNYIGTDLTGTSALPNGTGIQTGDSNLGNKIGGSGPGEGNLVSGNTSTGILIGSEGNTVQGNRVGTDAAGTGSIPGHSSAGVRIAGDQNAIGGNAAGAGNHIANNSNFGVVFASGSTYVGNLISGNSIHNNVNGGISLGNPSAPPDHCDGDGGNNGNQNAPVLTSVDISGPNVTVTGTLDSSAGTTYRIELFSNAACKAGLFDKEQGKTYLGFVDVTTDGSCNASFHPTFPIGPGEPAITATATNLTTKETSEFSSCRLASIVAVSSITPKSGPASGVVGAVVAGANFVSGATVTVGGVPAGNVAFNNSSQITLDVPALSPGAVYSVTVTDPDTSHGTLFDGWFADFLDVPGANGFHSFVEKLVRDSITAGCGAGNYCPGSSVSRAQMAVFLLRSNDGPTYTPPACVTAVFADVPCASPFAIWVDELSSRGVTAGCGGGLYCPNDPVTRAQMAVFLLRTKLGSGYTPPACVTPMFTDVPCSSGFAVWVNDLASRGITAGCGGGNYCPNTAATRGQMAVFLVTTFSLP